MSSGPEPPTEEEEQAAEKAAQEQDELDLERETQEEEAKAALEWPHGEDQTNGTVSCFVPSLQGFVAGSNISICKISSSVDDYFGSLDTDFLFSFSFQG